MSCANAICVDHCKTVLFVNGGGAKVLFYIGLIFSNCFEIDVFIKVTFINILAVIYALFV